MLCLIGSTDFSKVETTSNAAAHLTGFFFIEKVSAKNICDEGATNDILIGRFLKAQGITHLSWLLPQAAKILHSATLRPKFACANIVEFSFSAPNFMHTLRMTQGVRTECVY